MAGDYATISELRTYAYQSQTADETVLSPILTRSSRLFDRVCGLPEGYFDKTDAAAAAGQRSFWGAGTDYLRLDPYHVATAPVVAMPTGYTVPGYLQANHLATPRLATNAGEFFLVRVYGDNQSRFDVFTERRDFFQAEFSNDLGYIGWPAGIRAQVTAKWGWLAIPDDVREAVLELAVAIWRGRDQAFARVVNLESNVVYNDALPPRTKLVVDRYRQGRAFFA